MTEANTIDRRSYLRAVGAAGLATGLAGCLGEDGGDGAVSPTQGGTETPTRSPATPTATAAPSPTPTPEPVFWIDTHAHLHGGIGRGHPDRETVEQGAALALDTMPQFNVQMSLVMSPPSPRRAVDEYSVLMDLSQRLPQRFNFIAGGGSLNPLVQEAVAVGGVSASLRQQFEDQAAAIAASGAVAFGEMTALHFSFAEAHPYVEAPPDHPLFLLLAELAAQHGMPIDFHMEAVVQDKPMPRRLSAISSRNPPNLKENISAFERLLTHNRRARIVWAHVGWDNTGDMTVAQVGRLLAAHPNLFLQIKGNLRATFPQNHVLDRSGRLRDEWLALVRDYPDRFVLGTDTFYGERVLPSTGSLEQMRSFLNQLPADLAQKVGFENAVRTYRLPATPTPEPTRTPAARLTPSPSTALVAATLWDYEDRRGTRPQPASGDD